MRILDVIPARVWEHKTTGQRVSPYGVLPSERDQWELVQVGWTWKRDDGRIGLGRVPAKTEGEARDVMNRINGR